MIRRAWRRWFPVVETPFGPVRRSQIEREAARPVARLLELAASATLARGVDLEIAMRRPEPEVPLDPATLTEAERHLATLLDRLRNEIELLTGSILPEPPVTLYLASIPFVAGLLPDLLAWIGWRYVDRLVWLPDAATLVRIRA